MGRREWEGADDGPLTVGEVACPGSLCEAAILGGRRSLVGPKDVLEERGGGSGTQTFVYQNQVSSWKLDSNLRLMFGM